LFVTHVAHKILQHVEISNTAIQKKDIIIKAVKLINGLQNTIQEIRNTMQDTLNTEVPELAKKLRTELNLPTKRRNVLN
jgi:hypothetical protein